MSATSTDAIEATSRDEDLPIPAHLQGAWSVLVRGLRESPELRVGLGFTVVVSLAAALASLVTPVLIQQILFQVDQVPVFIAGGIATGRMMAHLLMMGAAGIQMGTRFVLSEECAAHPSFKEAFIRAKARDAVATPQFDSRLPVIPVRALKNEGTIEFAKLQMELLHKLDENAITREEAQFEVERFWVGALRRAAVDGDVVKGSLMAGQSVGLVKEIKPLAAIIQEMIAEAEEEMQRLRRIFDQAENEKIQKRQG